MVNGPQVVWHGTPDEGLALLAALAHNCGCEFEPEGGARTSCCAAHEAFGHSQRFLDGLLFERRIAKCLLREEFAR